MRLQGKNKGNDQRILIIWKSWHDCCALINMKRDILCRMFTKMGLSLRVPNFLNTFPTFQFLFLSET